MEQVSEEYSLGQHIEGESRHLGTPLVRWDLAKEMDELRRGEAWKTNGHRAKTLVKYPDLQVALIALKRGARLEEHKSAGRISIHAVEGHLRVRLSEQAVDLRAGCLLGLERALPHDLQALETSAVLLTLSF